MLRARHARHAGRQPLDAVLRRPARELFQPQGARVSSHLSFNCFVTLRVAPRVAAATASTGGGRGRARGVMAGGVMAGNAIRERVMVVERHVAPSAREHSISSLLPMFVSRPLPAAGRDGASSSSSRGRRQAHAWPPVEAAGDHGAIGSISLPRMFTAEGMDGRVFAAPRGLLQTEEAAQAFGHMVRRLRRQESRMTPVAAVTRRAPEAPGSEREGDERAPRDRTFTAPGIGLGMPTAMQMQAAADVNIEALASRVMQQIDRRLIAHRERMGRI
jgi:hypothetical protein